MSITINNNNDISTEMTLIPKTNKTDKKNYCIYIGFSVYEKSIKQGSHLVSTGINVPIADWKYGIIRGRNDKVKFLNERLDEYQAIGKAMLTELSLKKVKTCGELLKEIKLNARQRITGKAPRGLKNDFISKLKEYTYENVMNRLFVDKGISIGRQRGYNRSYELLKEFFQNDIPKIDMITDTELEAFKKWFLKNHNLKQNTATDYLSKIAAVIKYALSLKIITVNPIPEKFRGSFVDGNRKPLSEQECMAIINLKDEDLSPTELIAKYCFLVQLTTGIGYGDLKTLEASNIKYNATEEKLYIEKTRNKTGVNFKVYLSSRATQSLKKLIELTCEGEKPINIPSIDYSLRIYKELAKKAGIITNITTYTLRHTFAVNYMENDGRLEDLQKYLGHTDIKTTQIYGKISDKRLSQKMGELESKSRMHQLETVPQLKAV